MTNRLTSGTVTGGLSLAMDRERVESVTVQIEERRWRNVLWIVKFDIVRAMGGVWVMIQVGAAQWMSGARVEDIIIIL